MTIPNWVKAVAALLAVGAILLCGAGWYRSIGANAVLAASEASTKHSLDSLRTVAAVIDTEYRTDTIRLHQTVTVYTESRDTVLQHLTDTVQVKIFVQAADSVVRACSMLQVTCAERHAIDSATAAGWERMYGAERAARPSALATVEKIGVAALAGFAVGRIVK